MIPQTTTQIDPVGESPIPPSPSTALRQAQGAAQETGQRVQSGASNSKSTSESNQKPTPDQATSAGPDTSRPEMSVNDRMVQVRLGIHASLFHALKAKHPPTASHSLRVALGCSKWATWREIPDASRDLLEVAALLHDIGKIGVPDEVLQKPSRFNDHERMLMHSQRTLADELLTAAGAEPELINIVRASRLRYSEANAKGVSHSLASMLTIVDAFDSMTNEQVFRRAMSREAALEELCSNAGNQFDPELVEDFAILISQPRQSLELVLAQRWLSSLAPEISVGFDGVPMSVTPAQSKLHATPAAETTADQLQKTFHMRLLDSMTDAAIYLDANGQILNWNRGAEKLVGKAAASQIHHRWTADAVGLKDMEGNELSEDKCPLKQLVATNAQLNEQYLLCSNDGSHRVVKLQATPFSRETKNVVARSYCFKMIRDRQILSKRSRR